MEELLAIPKKLDNVEITEVEINNVLSEANIINNEGKINYSDYIDYYVKKLKEQISDIYFF